MVKDAKETKVKGPQTAFMMFSADMRPKLIAQHPELAKSVTEAAKKIGEAWGALGEAEKKKYQDKAGKAKAEHEAKHGPSKASKKKAAASDGPKKPLSAYMYFSAEYRGKVSAANPSAKITDVAKILGEQWKTVTAAEKSKFEAMAAKDKARYEAEKGK